MGKRTASEFESQTVHDARHHKRQRIPHVFEREPPTADGTTDEVTSGRQLQNALVFEQGSAANLRSGLNLFKTFLDAILYSTDDYDLPRKRAILREYLDTQRTRGRDDKEVVFLPNLIQAWEYAAETNFEALITQVVANLALLFKVFSTDTQFVEHGALLCKTMLQPSLLRRMHRSLSAPIPRETIISPILRLLTEMTRFNEGAYAKAVYVKKEFTLEPRTLARTIAMNRSAKEGPSIRTNAVHYLLAHLRYQDEVAKADILSSYPVIRALLDHLISDPPSLILEVLDVIKNHVFDDKTLPRYVKSRILGGKSLFRIANLYRYEHPDGDATNAVKTPDLAAHDFLCYVCTSPAYGVMLPSHGFYPPVKEGDDVDRDLNDAVHNAIYDVDDTASQPRTRNVLLADFIRSLRPFANTLHQELVVAIFKVCPELVAEYFLHGQAFQYDPQLTSTWIGYSSFLYQTIELPVPPFLGGRIRYRAYPPPTSLLIQSVLPQPLDQQVLTRCLNHNSELVKFFAVRVLIVAFHKLRSLLRELTNAYRATSATSWQESSKRLLTEFCRRCPPIKAIIVASQQAAFQKDIMREAITRLWSLYYEITPQVALQEKYDVSVPLCNTLMAIDNHARTSEERAIKVMELEHWIHIARHSASMRWWQKNKSLPYSPFMTLLKLVASSESGELYAGIRTLLLAILQDHDILQLDTHPDALDTLIASLGVPCGTSSTPTIVFEFLDDCCARFNRQPIKYFDDLDALRGKTAQSDAITKPISPVLMAFVEQWPFRGGKAAKDNSGEPIANWLSQLLYLFKLVGEDETLLAQIRDSLVASASSAYQEVLRDSFLWKMGKQKAKEALKTATGADFSGSERSSTSPVPPENTTKTEEVLSTVNLELPPREDERHSGLSRWRKKDIDESIDDGDVGDLLLCLCSKHAEIRLQAVSNVRQLMTKVDASESSDFIQLKVLLGEILETVEQTIASETLPYVGGVFAAHAVKVLVDPAHVMFGKINTFLMKRPSWNVEALPRYFGREVLNSEPGEDDSYHKEVDWYLEYLLDALRTPEDIEIFRTKNMFERLLSYYVSGSCAVAAREKIVRLLLRAAAVGGSTTLITRCGIVSWISMRLASNDHRHRELRLLAARLAETCDKEKVDEWSSGTAAASLSSLAKATVSVR